MLNLIIQIIIFISLGLGSLLLSSYFLNPSGQHILISVNTITSYFIPIALIYSITKIYRQWKPEIFPPAKLHWNLFSSLSLGWYVISVAVIFFIIAILAGNDFVQITLTNTLILLATCLCTACFEELLFRKLIQSLFIRLTTQQHASAWWGIMLTAATFALLHLLNLITQPQLLWATFSQVIYTFALGCMLGVIYFITRQLWSVIILHAFFNTLGSFILLSTNNLAGENLPDISAGALLFEALIILPGIYIARRQYQHLQ